MRIDPKLLTPPITDRPSLEPASALRPGGQDHAAAVVTLSSAGAAVQANGATEVMSPRLEQIQLQIDRGDYPIDLDKLAARIADDELARTSGGS